MHDLRTNLKLLVRPPHEIVDELCGAELEETETTRKIDAELRELYKDHDVYKEAGPDERIEPLGLYVDDTPFSNHSSFHGVFINSLRTGKRFLVAVARKESFCACGCLGHCSVAALQFFLLWSFNALAEGRWPSSRHDNKPWRQEDWFRARQIV